MTKTIICLNVKSVLSIASKILLLKAQQQDVITLS